MITRKLAIILASAFLFGACTHLPSTDTPTPPSPTPVSSAVPAPGSDSPETAVASPSADESMEFHLTAKRFAFDPSTITVPLNTKVRLIVTALDSGHGLAIPAFGISQPLPVGETTVEFTADKAGEFPFFCNIVCGSGHSDMTGSIIVEP